MNKKLLVVFLILIAVSFVSFKLSGRDYATLTNSGKPTVTVSIAPQRTFVKAVAGDLVEVVTVIPTGFSPANYEPSPKDAMSLSKTAIYFTIGVQSERDYILPTLKSFNKSLKVVELHKKVEEIYLPLYLGDKKDESSRDPHIWLSPLRVKVMVQVICNELCELDPKNEETYKKNTQDYLEALQLLHKSILNSLSNTTKRSFIVYHPAYGYFANDYNLLMTAVESDGKEATAKRIKEVVDFAKQEDIRFIFYQDEFDDNQANIIATEINGTVIKTSPLASNYVENMQLIAENIANALK
ncbi:zinc ABC transporter substrate-binding protein [Clostridium sp. 'deep sea']|uniref:metal ABC transporter solute-binding protein, Zn/Mn family n=1 Tax=Clostridium sp. 'deep sea' TaxID=2779445 RepID=UPI00189642D5|nr:zinc ABC transporter substrate-binding protein [Clostridium sp. 'deep sea']QOR34211.1 zinc ABC transporter substrate-binding protein [Clostridium sp. 'deep sea']